MDDPERRTNGAEPEPRPSRAPTRLRTLYLPLLLLAALVAFTDLGGRSVHDMDVPRGAALAREMLQSGHWLVPRLAGEVYVNKPPLYIWLVAAPAALVGDVTPFLARLPAALAFLALVLMSLSWALGRTGSVTAARITGLLVLSTLALAWLGREAKLDMLAAALSFGGAALIDGAAHGRARRRHVLWAGLVLGLGLLTKGPLVLLVPLAVLLVGGEPGTRLRDRLRRARVGRTFGLAALVALAWFLPALLQGGSAYGEALVLGQAATRIAGAGNHLQAPWYYLVAMPVWALPWGPLYLLALVAACLPRWSALLGPTAGLARAAVLLVVLYSLVPTKHMRYLAPVLPLLAISVAWWARTTVLPRVAVLPRPCVHLALILGLAAVGVVAACRLSTVGGWAALLPAAGLVLAGAWCYRRRAQPRALFHAVLLGAVFAVSAVTVLRYRFRVRRHVRFNQELARTLESDSSRVWTVAPWHPEDLFLGAPRARPLPSIDAAGLTALPPDALIVCDVAAVAELEAARGLPARIVFTEPRTGGRVIVRFDAAPAGD